MACVVSTTTSTMAQFDFLADPESEQQGNRRGSSAGGAGISTIPSVSDNDESLSDVDADVADLVSIRDEELEDVSSLVDQFATARGRRGRAHRGPPEQPVLGERLRPPLHDLLQMDAVGLPATAESSSSSSSSRPPPRSSQEQTIRCRLGDRGGFLSVSFCARAGLPLPLRRLRVGRRRELRRKGSSGRLAVVNWVARLAPWHHPTSVSESLVCALYGASRGRWALQPIQQTGTPNVGLQQRRVVFLVHTSFSFSREEFGAILIQNGPLVCLVLYLPTNRIRLQTSK